MVKAVNGPRARQPQVFGGRLLARACTRAERFRPCPAPVVIVLCSSVARVPWCGSVVVGNGALKMGAANSCCAASDAEELPGPFLLSTGWRITAFRYPRLASCRASGAGRWALRAEGRPARPAAAAQPPRLCSSRGNPRAGRPGPPPGKQQGPDAPWHARQRCPRHRVTPGHPATEEHGTTTTTAGTARRALHARCTHGHRTRG